MKSKSNCCHKLSQHALSIELPSGPQTWLWNSKPVFQSDNEISSISCVSQFVSRKSNVTWINQHSFELWTQSSKHFKLTGIHY